MPARIEIPVNQFRVDPFRIWEQQWFLLTAGDFTAGKYNTMTVGWGYFGRMWGQPSAVVVVRPQRYTAQFMEDGDSFTLCAFSEKYRSALNLCGAKSGRDMDKIAAAGLTPIASACIKAPGFQEADLILECQKNYRDVFRRESFLDAMIPQEVYARGDYHCIYAGEIKHISGTEQFSVKK